MNLTPVGEKLTDAKLLDLVGEFNAKMVRIMDSVGYLQKDAQTEKKGNFAGYTYATARKVLDKVRDECVVEGISVESESDIEEFHIVGTKSLAVVKTTLYFTDGIFIARAQGLGSGIDSGDKAVMKADTAAIKYACSGKFLISWGDDPEADPASGGQEENFKLTEVWLPACENASHATAEKFAPWWETYGDQVKTECGEGAAVVYDAYKTYLKRLKADADASD